MNSARHRAFSTPAKPEAGAALQAMVLCTSREIALQAAETLDNLAHACGRTALRAGVFIGGLPMAEDLKLLRRCACASIPARVWLAGAIIADL